MDQLETLSRQLWKVGIAEVFADGSFAEDKDHPNDIDRYGNEQEFPSAFRQSRRDGRQRGIIKIVP